MEDAEMDDAEFLNYLEAMTETPDCGIVPKHIARLFRLAGREEDAVRWDGLPLGVIRGAHSEVAQLVKEARDANHTL